MRFGFYLNKFSTLALCAAVLALAACGGGGGGSGAGVAAFNFPDSFGRNALGSNGGVGSGGGGGSFSRGDSGADGSAGDGLPIVGATVVISDSTLPTPKTVTVVTDSAGYYRANVTGLTPPFVAKLIRPDGVVRYSLSVTPLKTNGFVTMNITGLTSQIASSMAIAAGLPNMSGFTGPIVGSNANSLTGPTGLVGALNTILSPVIVAAGLDPTTFNPLTLPFVPNFTGYDFVLDNTSVTTAPSTGFTTVAVPSTFVAGTPTQTANLAQAMTEARAMFASINAVYAGTPTAASFAPFIASGYLGNVGVDANASTAEAYFASFPKGGQVTLGGLAPYDGSTGQSEGPNVTFDPTSNCVSSMWVKLNYNGLTHEYTRLDNTAPTRSNCSSGSWQLAGSRRQFHSRITAELEKLGSIYRSGLFLETLSSQTGAYAYVEISGPGITTLGGSPAPVRLIPGSTSLTPRNVINDPYYGSASTNPYYGGALEGTSLLQACSEMAIDSFGTGAWRQLPTSSTPCLVTAAAVAGSDYTIQYFSAQGVLLETDMQRLEVALPTPTAIGQASSLPANLYATFNSVTPAGVTMTSAGGTVTGSWTLPSGAQPVLFGLNINDASGTTLKNVDHYVSAAATSASIAVPALPQAVAPRTGLPGTNSSFAFVVTSVGGIMVLTGTSY